MVAVANHALPLPVVNHALPVVDHALSVSSDSGNSTASVKTDRTDDPQSQPGGAGGGGGACVIQSGAEPPLSPREKRELEQLLSGLEGGPQQQHQARQGYPSPGGGGSPAAGGILHLVPAQIHVNGRGGIRTILAAAGATDDRDEAERETDILDDELPGADISADSLLTISSLDGHETPATDSHRHSVYQTPQQQQQPSDSTTVDIEGPSALPELRSGRREMPVHQVHGSASAQERLIDYNDQNGSMYRSQSYGATPALDAGRNDASRHLPQTPERSTSSREAVQRGLNAWHQYGLVDDPFFGPMSGLSRFPTSPSGASQNDVEQSIEALNMLMLDLEPTQTPVPKSQSAPPGDNPSLYQTPFAQNYPRPSYQGDQAIHSYASGYPPSSSASYGQFSQRSSPAYPPMSPSAEPHRGAFHLHHSSSPTHPQEAYVHRGGPGSPTPTLAHPQPLKPQSAFSQGGGGGSVCYTPELQGMSPYPPTQRSYSASSSPLPSVTPAREVDPEEESLNLSGLVAHRIAGEWLTGMSGLVFKFSSIVKVK